MPTAFCDAETDDVNGLECSELEADSTGVAVGIPSAIPLSLLINAPAKIGQHTSDGCFNVCIPVACDFVPLRQRGSACGWWAAKYIYV